MSSITYRRPEGLELAVYRLGVGLVDWVHARMRVVGDVREASARRRSTLRNADAAYEAATSRARVTRLGP